MKKVLLSLGIVIVGYQWGFSQSTTSEKDSLGEVKKKSLIAPWWVEKFKVSLGGFVPISNTDIKVSATGPNGTVGTEISFEDDLGFNRTSGTLLTDFQYRLTRRSRFDLSYIRLNRSASKVLQKDIIFDNDTFHINNKVSAFFNSGIYRFSYGYSILTNSKFEVGLLFGLHILSSDAGLSTVGTNTSLAVAKDFGFTAPLPDFGVWGGYAFSDRWSANGEFDYFGLTIGDVDGRILGGQIGVTYRIYDKLDITAGWTGFNFKVDVTKPRAYGSLKWGYSGPSLTISYAFGKKGWTTAK